MAHTYDGKYRVESSRLSGWDYRSSACYFVTFCTKNHTCLLGHILDGVAYISPLGLIVAEEWWRTPHIRPYVSLDDYQVMPNHFHGIIIITDSQNSLDAPVTTEPSRLQAHSIGSIVGQVKSACTKRIRDLGCTDFAWQPRFYDHIIRSEPELERIRAYITGNPGKWHEDRYYLKDVEPTC